MLKENCLKYTTNCSSNHPYAFIVRPLDTNNKDLRIMLMEITEEQENELDNNKSISIEKGSYKFNIEPDMCYAYGKLDLSPNSKDIENIYKANWFSNFDINIFIPSEYNYEDNSVTSDIKGGRVYGTSNVKKYLPFLYASINQPDRVVLFKEYLNIEDVRKNKIKAKKDNYYKKPKSNYNKEKNKEKIESKRRAKISNLKFTIKY